jgi:putative FmdB family regulatory protein
MPVYLYECRNCGEFEITHSIKEELNECPKCQAAGKEPHKPTRLIAPTSFILEGGGWASEGYNKK